MKINLYEDRACRKEIGVLDLNEIFGGDTKIYEFYIKNEDSKNYLREIKYKLGIPKINKQTNERKFIQHPELSILEAPVTLNPKESGIIKIRWKANVDLEAGLKGVILEMSAQKVCVANTLEG